MNESHTTNTELHETVVTELPEIPNSSKYNQLGTLQSANLRAQTESYCMSGRRRRGRIKEGSPIDLLGATFKDYD